MTSLLPTPIEWNALHRADGCEAIDVIIQRDVKSNLSCALIVIYLIIIYWYRPIPVLAVSFPVVLCFDKRHLGHDGIAEFVPDTDLELRPRFVESFLHVAHGDVLLQARAECATGDLAHDLALRRNDGTVLTRGGARANQTNAPALGPFLELLLDDIPSDKVPLLPPPLANRPREPRLDGADVHVEVVAIEAQPRLEPQAVPGAKPC
mmetsp:Transcript_13485/g.33865  ORF Transcript_13485/g.33865 Transcript_13485/m.33865 type:complete len:207 (-) Transcript_13485:949-1569(-)